MVKAWLGNQTVVDDETWRYIAIIIIVCLFIVHPLQKVHKCVKMVSGKHKIRSQT